MSASQGATTSMTIPQDLAPETLLSRLAASGLRGRGGGWFPAARKWRAVLAEAGRPVVIANGAEGEPGSHKDRFVMLKRPEAVVEGLRLAARALSASEAIVFLKASFDAPAQSLASALASAHERSALDGLRVTLRRGDDGYITGEETALLESLEGRRPWPRPKPPLPAGVGLEGRPTLVQNVETLARVPQALADPDAFKAAESTLVTFWGDVRRPGVREVRLGTPLRAAIEEHAGGATEEIALVFPAGPAAAPLRPDELDTGLEPEALRARGSGLGTGALLVVGASACPLAVAASVAAFYERESCGQCPPCTVGTASLAKVLRGLEAGGIRPRELVDLRDVAGFMSGHGYCAHCRSAATLATSVVERLAPLVERHAAAGCPFPERRHPDPFAPGSPERRTLAAAVEEQLA
jgi:NADH-quinone oxidoreductase subunit F